MDASTSTAATLTLSRSLDGFMRYFLVHVNPILHRTEYDGRSWSEYEIVVPMALRLCGPLRPTDLSSGLKIEKSSLSAVLKRLRARGYITREAIAGDDRSYRVALTDAGWAFARHLDAQRDHGIAALFAAMPPDDLAAAARGLDLIAAYLKRWEDDRVPSPAPDGAAA